MIHEGFILTQHTVENNNQTDIIIWVSATSGPIKLIIKGERPVLFVKQSDKLQVIYSLKPIDDLYLYTPLTLKTFSQEPVAAIYCQCLKDYYRVQSLLGQSGLLYFEYDIRLQERYLMERFIYGSLFFTGEAHKKSGYTEFNNVTIKSSDFIPNLRILSFDIECAVDGQLYSVAFYSNHNGLPLKHVIMIGDNVPHTENIQWVRSEKNLLIALVKLIQDFDPDIIIGWNVINFDCRLLIQRAKVYNMRLALGRDNAVASWLDSTVDTLQGFVRIPGRVVIDGIDALRTATYQFPDFSLQTVSLKLLGKGKHIDNGINPVDTITWDFYHNKKKLAAYNQQDAILVWDIFAKTRVLDFLVFRSQLTGLPLDKKGGSVAAFTNLYLPRLHRSGYIAPNLPEGGGLASPGGYVMSSKPGLYKNVLVFDYKSLYPSIIRTFKIDPLGLVEGLRLDPSGNVNNEKRINSVIPGFRGGIFSRQHHILPDIIKKLWQQREEAKKSGDSEKSQAIKLIMNSFYGVLGSGGCRFYDTRLASSITLRGHEIIQQTKVWVEEQGYTVIYGDTDSLFVQLDSDLSSKSCQQLGDKLKYLINGYWKKQLHDTYQLESYLELEFETYFSRFLMPTIRGSDIGSKKRYAGIMQIKENGELTEKIVFKGLEAVRTDWTLLAREFQKKLYHCVFNDISPVQLIRQTVVDTLAGKYDDQLIYRKRLRKPLDSYVRNVPPQVRAARMADAFNKANKKPLQYQNKGWINYVMTKQGPEPVENQLHPLDYNHYIDKQLQPIADAILPFTGLSFSVIIDTQLSLF